MSDKLPEVFGQLREYLDRDERSTVRFLLGLFVTAWLGTAALLSAEFVATDPGVRGGPPGAGGPVSGLSSSELEVFLAGQDDIQEVDSVQGTIPGTGLGLGPRFNNDSCGGCHAQPAPGGSSPFVNPQVAVATKAGATNIVPFFITIDGPVRDAIRRSPVNLLNLYTITGRTDAPGCAISQPDFDAEAARNNLAFHIPTPLFGGGLVETIDDATILANRRAHSTRKAALGIHGRPQVLAPEGAIGRFGWKAQGRSLLLFAGGAYNAEVGVTTLVSPTERDQTPSCQFNATPEDHFNFDAPNPVDALPDFVKIALFARFLAPPTPAPDTPSTARGRALFSLIGCALCHTPSLVTGASVSRALGGKRVDLFSDLLLHRMGPGLADGIAVGVAGRDEFRTAPLWGLGQRIFFLHDGRTPDLRQAITAHASVGDAEFPPSEANAVIAAFNALDEAKKQDVLNFLRAL